jgi:hypothetical protein
MHKHRVHSVTPLDNYKLFVVFRDASEKVYDVRPLFAEIPAFKRLEEDRALFDAVRPELNGNAIVWNDDLDLASDELFVNGKVLSHSD